MKVYLTYTIFLAMFLTNCVITEEENPQGSEVTNGNITGKIYLKDGSPAVNAKVDFIPSSNNPYQDTLTSNNSIISTTTDDMGMYHLDYLDKGFYNLLAEKGSNKSFMDSIYIHTERKINIDDNTLLPTGNISGFVRLEDANAPRTDIFILIMGTNRYVTTETTEGSFSMEDFAPGTYQIRIFTTQPNYEPIDTTLSFISDSDIQLTDTLVLPFYAPPKPKPFFHYDSLKMTAKLSWSPAQSDRIVGWNIYRSINGTDFTKINQELITDTSFVDFIFHQLSDTLSYGIKSVDKEGNEGLQSDKIEREIHSPFSTDTASFPVTSRTWNMVLNSLGNIVEVSLGKISEFNTKGELTRSKEANILNQNYQDLFFKSLQIDSRDNLYVISVDSSGVEPGTTETPWNAYRLSKFDADFNLIKEVSLDIQETGYMGLNVYNDSSLIFHIVSKNKGEKFGYKTPLTHIQFFNTELELDKLIRIPIYKDRFFISQELIYFGNSYCTDSLTHCLTAYDFEGNEQEVFNGRILYNGVGTMNFSSTSPWQIGETEAGDLFLVSKNDRSSFISVFDNEGFLKSTAALNNGLEVNVLKVSNDWTITSVSSVGRYWTSEPDYIAQLTISQFSP